MGCNISITDQGVATLPLNTVVCVCCVMYVCTYVQNEKCFAGYAKELASHQRNSKEKIFLDQLK